MQPSSTAHSSFSIFGGAMIIGGTIVGAGMFSLPSIMAGMWFYWAIALLLFTWFCMLHSGLMILEANLHYPIGASFDTIIKDLLGNAWNIINGITVAFVLYILTYAYISASGAALGQTLREYLHLDTILTHSFGMDISNQLAGFCFGLVGAFIVWFSTKLVSRLTTIFLCAKIIAFFMTFGALLHHVDTANLFNHIEAKNTEYWPYTLMALPFCLASFGFHGNVPSLVKYYGKSPKIIVKALIYGTSIALILYIIWIICTMGNISRPDFKVIIAQNANVDTLVETFKEKLHNTHINLLLLFFANFAVVSSFLGVTLGLFDYIADLFKFDNSPLGRFKTAMITFAPPLLAGVIYPNGFIYAIGFAGLAATVWTAIVPALLTRASRKRFSENTFRVWGGNYMITLILFFGMINAASHILHLFNLLPIYR